ncbi:uncharacterized protein LOC120260923 isoform X1 [Dioscorea cayenensis subsp. rotundata]|uniref:Uncharacterized protein LOC120260923 isoform X1 n=1 Tax=Dioscorea cayennensis subsp. rotundata TaxID=55577 RepID=A0AB40BCW8_DIOCR|nr:uncharacterized protein LOC120260923 isoform X1 [Dioscorea cayenensis subsp. rotundata]XP_039124458.1 uncharacterized protein LOC120260923 isoform X1 [Dioscorea cayenensis subsp. rotundata]
MGRKKKIVVPGPRPFARRGVVKEEVKVEEPVVDAHKEVLEDDVVEEKQEEVGEAIEAVHVHSFEDKEYLHEDKEPENEEVVAEYEEKEIEDEAGQEEHVEEGDEEADWESVDEEMVDEMEGEMGEEIEEEVKDNGEDAENEKGNMDSKELGEQHKEHRKQKEFEVFVGGLDKDATEDDLKKVFGAVGNLVEVRLMRNHLTKKNKGFAFLRFETAEQAKRAVLELKNPIVNGKRCGVAPSKDSDTLFLGNIHRTWTKEHLKDTLKSYGIESFEDLNLLEDVNNAGMNRGFAFLEFTSRKEAIYAYRQLQKSGARFGTARPAKITFAESFLEPDDEVMAQVKTVFVDGIPAGWDEDHLKGYVKEFGEIKKVDLARNMPGARRRDFGFVTFDTHDNAVKCVLGINGQELVEGQNKKKVRARLSRPVKKERVNTGSQRDFWSSQGDLRGRAHASWDHRPAHIITQHPSRPQRFLDVPTRGHGSQRHFGFHVRQLNMAPPMSSYERRPLVPDNSLNREYHRHGELNPRNIASVDYGSRASYREDYSSHGSGYSDIVPRGAPRVMGNRPYAGDVYGQLPERPSVAYRGDSHDYVPISGSKRPYLAPDYAPPPYFDASMRHTRPRLDYGAGARVARYENANAERFGQSDARYGSSHASFSGHDPHVLSGRHQGMSYGRVSASGIGASGMHSTGFSSHLPRDHDQAAGSSYPASYPGHSFSGSRHMGGGGSGIYY